nr:MAG TPA: hypothetical protein [Ackermannviridae sp.]
MSIIKLGWIKVHPSFYYFYIRHHPQIRRIIK